LKNEELNNQILLGSKYSMKKGAVHVSCRADMRNKYKILVGKPEEEMRRYQLEYLHVNEGIILKRILREEGMDWIYITQDRVQ
jgi:hypothetical protein